MRGGGRPTNGVQAFCGDLALQKEEFGIQASFLTFSLNVFLPGSTHSQGGCFLLACQWHHSMCRSIQQIILPSLKGSGRIDSPLPILGAASLYRRAEHFID